MRHCGALLKLIGAIALVATTTACGGQNNWVKDASVETYNYNGDIYGSVKTYLDSGSMSLPSLDLPIYDPRMPSQPMGSFSIKNSLYTGAKSELAVSVNLTRVAKLPGAGGDPLLPNGQPIPVAGVDPNNLMVFNVAGNKTKIYLDLDKASQRAMFGVAVPIRQFDNIGRYTGGANLFPGFQLDNGLRGTFGIFTGVTSGTSGFALFLDASGLTLGQGKDLTIAGANSTSDLQSYSYQQRREFEYLDQAPDYRQEDRILRGLYKLNKRETQLDLAQ